MPDTHGKISAQRNIPMHRNHTIHKLTFFRASRSDTTILCSFNNLWNHSCKLVGTRSGKPHLGEPPTPLLVTSTDGLFINLNCPSVRE